LHTKNKKTEQKAVIIFLSLLLSIVSYGTSSSVLVNNRQVEVKFEIIQNEHSITICADTFFLKKEPFVIRIQMRNALGVYLNFSYSDAYHRMPTDEAVESLFAKVMAEYNNSNSHKNIIIDSTSFHYWSCQPEKNNPYDFNKFNFRKWEKYIFTGERYVNYFFEMNKDHPIAEINKTIYVFLLIMKHEHSKPVKELIRKKYVIKWE
jgi:hypothetical protein